MNRGQPKDRDEAEVKSQAKRRQLIAKTADALLAEGVAQIPLRDLAQRLGTSDRMLLYYFDDKAELVRAAILEVSARLAAMLAASSSTDRRPPAEVLDSAARTLASPSFAPFMSVWSDLSARGSRGEEPFRSIAQQSIAQWLAWIDARLAIPNAAKRRSVASALLAVVEGVRLLEAAAPGSAKGVTEFLAGSFAASTAST